MTLVISDVGRWLVQVAQPMVNLLLHLWVGLCTDSFYDISECSHV